MSAVPREQLSNLRCLKCKKYLSYFPIYQSVRLQGSICGRHPIEDNIKRNTAYEEIATVQKFPCCYDVNGCLEYLYPDEVPRHEECCIFRKYVCPTRKSTECKWEGLVKDMWDHVEYVHPVFIMRDDGFEVNFIRQYNENYLMKFENELYIVNETNSKNNELSVSVLCIGTKINTENYVYRVKMFNATNKRKKFITNTAVGYRTILNRDHIIRDLKNPTTVVAQIEISKTDDKKEDRFEEVQWSLMSELECSCCFEYMLPPVQQCTTGHSICSNCKVKQDACPTCKQEFKNTVNITLGNIIEHLIYPCKYEGCKFTCKAVDMKKHQSNCTFGKFRCPLSDYEECNQEIPYVKLYDHILKNHYENLLEVDTISLPFEYDDEEDVDEDDKNETEDCFILRYDFRLFVLHYKYELGVFFWEMQLIGTPNKNETYQFEIDVVDNDTKRRICLRSDCTTFSNKTEAFGANRSFIFIEYTQISYMIGDEFTYSVRILPKS